MRDYLINSIPYTEVSGGTGVLRKLKDELIKRGYRAYINECPIVCRPALHQSNMGLDMANTIVVYTEEVVGNPLKSAVGVNYILMFPQFTNIKPQQYSPNLVFYHSAMLMDNDGRFLQIQNTDDKVFYDRNADRTKRCFYMDPIKQSYNETIAAKLWVDGWIPITRKPRKPPTKEKLAELFQESSIFLTYDGMTGLIDEARLCGCPVHIKTTKWGTKDQYAKESLNGLAFNDAEIETARQTVHLFRDDFLKKKALEAEQIENFIKLTQECPSALI